ncbi:hypothetical protein HY642_05145 [Candidatus Woesearchaeota archaeon]|nr:hypothetical protein [Candidatus Woesearchaeota archaeon]
MNGYESDYEKRKRWNRARMGCAAAFLGSLAIGAGYIIGGITNRWEYSRGERVGVINKLSEKGAFWKTQEGELALEGIVSSGDGSGANIWQFSIDSQRRNGEKSEELVKQLQQYMREGTRVRIEYVEPVKTWPWRSETDYLVQKVEPASRGK